MIRRICLYGGPGSGKSTLSAKIFHELKCRQFDVELISEYVKTWAHEGRRPISYDQLYVFAKQLKAEDVILRNVQTVVTDSPLLMNAAYSRLYKFQCSGEIIKICQQFDRDFPPLNLFTERTVDYVNKGRYQNHNEAIDFDNFLKEHLDDYLQGKFIPVRVDEFDSMIEMIGDALNASNT